MVTDQYAICEKCGQASLHRFGGLCPECDRKKYNWRNFYRAIRLYAVGKISRERFMLEWSMEQREQGITPQRRRVVRP